MLQEDKITEIYYLATGFCKIFDERVKKYTLEENDGKPVGAKGYISKEVFQKQSIDGIQLITKVKNNMKSNLMSVSYKISLHKRAVIDSVNDKLMNIAQQERVFGTSLVQ